MVTYNMVLRVFNFINNYLQVEHTILLDIINSISILYMIIIIPSSSLNCNSKDSYICMSWNRACEYHFYCFYLSFFPLDIAPVLMQTNETTIQLCILSRKSASDVQQYFIFSLKRIRNLVMSFAHIRERALPHIHTQWRNCISSLTYRDKENEWAQLLLQCYGYYP